MIGKKTIQKVLWADKGSSAIEFAVISIPMIFMIFGAMDVGYQAYAASVLQGTTYSAARKIVLEDAAESTVETYVRNQLSAIAQGTNIEIDSDNFLSYSKIGKPEKLTTDVNNNKQYDKDGPDCFVDDNKNKKFDLVSDGKAGIGSAEDIVRYTVTMKYSRLTPVASVMGFSPIVTLTRTTFMRNEPYAGIIDPPVECGV